MNELSNTTDLESTLIRAEALFRKFQRHVEAIDKKQNFPAPRVGSSSGTPLAMEVKAQAQSQSQTKGTQKSPANDSKGKDAEAQQKMISPELRRLLSRKVDVLSRNTVEKQGDGMPGK